MYGVTIAPAADGGFIVWSAEGEMGRAVRALFAGALDECLDYARKRLEPAAIKDGGDDVRRAA